MSPQPNSNSPQNLKAFARKAGVALIAVGALLIPATGVPGIVLFVVGLASLAISGFFKYS